MERHFDDIRFALAKFRPTTLPDTLVARSGLHDRLTAGAGQPSAPYRPLTDRADIVELSLVSRDRAHEPLTEHFLRIATG